MEPSHQRVGEPLATGPAHDDEAPRPQSTVIGNARGGLDHPGEGPVIGRRAVSGRFGPGRSKPLDPLLAGSPFAAQSHGSASPVITGSSPEDIHPP
jgi:hypothetical protein